MLTSRRQLLKGAGAAALVAELGLIRRAVFGETEALDTSSSAGASASIGPDWPELYSLDPGVTYLNHASIGTIPRAVQKAHQSYLELCETNPWLYVWSEPWAEPREQVRVDAANLLGCDSEEVAIVHNTTEFFNVLSAGLPLKAGDEVLFGSLNHAGASVCFEHQAAAHGYSVRRFDFPLDDISEIDVAEIVGRYEKAINPDTTLLVLPHVDNQVGLRHPIAEIAAMARARGVRWIAVDGAQTAGMLPLDVHSMGADVFVTSAHKWVQAPKGLGLAYVRRSLAAEIRPMWVTWGQKRWQGDARVFEDYGTRAMPAVLALGDAIRFQKTVETQVRDEHYKGLWRALRDLVGAQESLAWRSPTDWSLSAPLMAVEPVGQSSSDVAARLFAEHGIVVRPFSLPDLNALRVSPNLANGRGDLERLVAAVA